MRRSADDSLFCVEHVGPPPQRDRIADLQRQADAAEAQAQAVIERVSRGASQIVCPHCQVRGRVTTRRVRRKRGISGGKATGAILTGGLSMLGTGLSRKETLTEMYCRNCRTTWTV